MLATCEVPLFGTTIGTANGNEPSITCFELWHSTPVVNLKYVSNEMNAQLAVYQHYNQNRGTDNINQGGQCKLDCEVNGAYTYMDNMPPLPGENLNPTDECSAVGHFI